jgi:GNAT superfamily N-acetyltransferase
MIVRRGTQAVDLRPVRPDELTACAAIWRVAINDYTSRLGEQEIPDDLTSVTTLYRHLQTTDPERFVVATRPVVGGPGDTAPATERIVGFAAAVVRGNVWFLSMLFVLPEEQGLGLGRTLLDRVLPPAGAGLALGTATDSAQPISNALYSRYGIVPRIPLLHLVGDVRRPDALPRLPAGLVATPFEATEDELRTGPQDLAWSEVVGPLDLEVAGFEHPEDHRHLAAAGRRGFLYRDAAGAVEAYGYTSESGRVGPVAVRDRTLLPPVLGHLLRTVQARGAFAAWIPGAAGETVSTLLAAGLRLEDFPILLCWDRPFADFSRYVPISPGLL